MTTRSALTVLLVVILAGGSVQAAGKLGIGVKAGLGFATSHYEYDLTLIEVDRDWRTGFAVGAVFDYPLLPIVSLRPEFLYVQKGSKETFQETTEQHPEGTGKYVDIYDRVDYLSIQLLGKVHTPHSGPSPYLLAGPRLDIKVRNASDFEGSNAMDKSKSTIFGGTVGCGIEFPVSPVARLFLEFEYYPDFSNAVDETSITVTNKSCAATVGLMF